MSDVELMAADVEARRQFVEKKPTRDTHRARLEWIKAAGHRAQHRHRRFGEDCPQGSELREMTHDVDLLKIGAEIIAIVIRSRGASAQTGAQSDHPEREGP
jgi:hypothetical protein